MDNNNICRCRGCDGIIHEVVAGDTLYLISRKHNVPVGSIIRENRGINPYNLIIGDKLCIPISRYNDYRETGMENGSNNVNNSNTAGTGNSNDRNISNRTLEEKYDMEFEEISEADMINRETMLSDLVNVKNMTVGKFADIIKNI